MSLWRDTDSGTRMCSTFLSDPVSRLSTQITRWPRRRSSSHRCDPRNPAPPVTRQVAMDPQGTAYGGTQPARKTAPAPISARGRPSAASSRRSRRRDRRAARAARQGPASRAVCTRPGTSCTAGRSCSSASWSSRASPQGRAVYSAALMHVRPEVRRRAQRMQRAGQVGSRAMPDPAFVDRLNEQIGYEFGASQQYVAAAVYYDNETLPRLAAFLHAQAPAERTHAMKMVKYLMDADAEVVIPGIAAPRSSFSDIVEPVRVALEQEKRVSDQINALAAVARQAGDYSSEQFMQWFIKEQVEEVASMADLLRVVQRSRENPMFAEDFLAREQPGAESEDPTAPTAAGGAV